jgi:hypothetical protein
VPSGEFFITAVSHNCCFLVIQPEPFPTIVVFWSSNHGHVDGDFIVLFVDGHQPDFHHTCPVPTAEGSVVQS